MYKTQPTMTGGCQCGAVRYALFETPESTVCHCRMCQKAVGGPFAALSKVKWANFAWTRGQPASFQSSSAAERHFCAACGTSLTFHFLVGDEIEVTTGSLDSPAIGTADKELRDRGAPALDRPAGSRAVAGQRHHGNRDAGGHQPAAP